MNQADLARWYQLHRGLGEIEAVRRAEEVVIRRRDMPRPGELFTPASANCRGGTRASPVVHPCRPK